MNEEPRSTETRPSLQAMVENTARGVCEMETSIVAMAGRAVTGTVKTAGSVVVDTLGVARDIVRAALDA